MERYRHLVATFSRDVYFDPNNSPDEAAGFAGQPAVAFARYYDTASDLYQPDEKSAAVTTTTASASCTCSSTPTGWTADIFITAFDPEHGGVVDAVLVNMSAFEAAPATAIAAREDP